MPRRAKRLCDVKQSRRTTDAIYDAGRKHNPEQARAARFRGSGVWRRKRSHFIKHHPLCYDPFGHHKTTGVFVWSQQVHHVRSLIDRYELRLDEFNLAALCAVCHRRIEAIERRGRSTADLFEKGHE